MAIFMFQNKNTTTYILALGLSISLMCGFTFRSVVQETFVRAGASTVNITPPFGYPHYRGESSGANDSLYARALVLKQGENTVALVICDLLWVERGLSSSVRLLVSEKTGIPYSNIIIAGTHTHTGPSPQYTRTYRDASPAI